MAKGRRILLVSKRTIKATRENTKRDNHTGTLNNDNDTMGLNSGKVNPAETCENLQSEDMRNTDSVKKTKL